MNRVAIITGGAGGMGLACAKILGKDHTLVICDLNQDKLDDARAELEQLDITVKTIICDICDSGSVQNLFAEAKELGMERVCIISNGLRLGNADYSKQLKDAGLNEVLFSVHRPWEPDLQ